jgi:CubicO group peptidase (beta-lactamase class C family)
MNIKDILIENQFNGSVMVYTNDQILALESLGYSDIEHKIPFHPTTRMRIGSITKQMTAAGIMLLVNQGLLSLHQTIQPFFPDYRYSHRITIHHLLTHTSGIANYPVDGDYSMLKDEPDFYMALIKNIIDPYPLHFEPGSSFEYSGSGYIFLTKIIELISKKTYPQFMNESIFKPLNMINTGFDDARNLDLAKAYDGKDGYVFDAPFVDMRIAGGGGGLFSSMEDLLIWNRSILNHQLLDVPTIDLMQTRHFEIDESNASGYGLFLALEHDANPPQHLIYHAGGGPGVQAMNTYFVEQNIGLIMMSNVNDKKRFTPVREKLYNIIRNYKK